MCGICGYFHQDSDKILDPYLLEKMNNKLAHRGPDGEGYYVKDSLAMAMRRLAIIDIASGQQPIFNEDKKVVVTFNGEIFNFRELRQELESSGHSFYTQSDTEVIVHAYEEWGDDCLNHLNGMFAIALWDDVNKRLLLARDQLGKKPLYWHNSDRGLVWGSELKSLLILPWLQKNINILAIHHYLSLQYVPNPLTIYEGINQLPAAHKLTASIGHQPLVERWWGESFEPKWTMTKSEVFEQARQLLRSAVKRRLISEVPLGLFLSGGLDSSVIAALMTELSSTPVKTFTIDFIEPIYSESRYARQVAARYRCEHYELVFRPDDVTRVIEDVLSATDEPFADPAALPLFELARQAKQQITVALCGDGGDETLAGYPRYALEQWLRPFNRLLATGVLETMQGSLIGLNRLGRAMSMTEKASIVRWDSYFSHKEKMQLYSPAWREALISTDTTELISDTYDQALAKDYLDCDLSTDQSTYLPGDLLTKTDRVSMAHALEVRSPFLDLEWVEWTARLPARFKIRGLKTKWLLKQAFRNLLQPEIYRRSKHGFSVPVGLWMKNELKEWTKMRLVSNHNFVEMFSNKEIVRLLNEHIEGKTDHGKRLWTLLMLAVWIEINV